MDLVTLRAEVLSDFGNMQRLAKQAAHEIQVDVDSQSYRWREQAVLIRAKAEDIIRNIDRHTKGGS